MSLEHLAQKLADLTRRVEKLETTAAHVAPTAPIAKGTWREATGFAKDDDLFDEAMRLGVEWRARANQEGQ
jgi:hypothetical protein